ncbi:acetolactate synthase large subunit [Ferrimonas marina]|uniref:Acetolactate synthase-1/2/3 large subunit n=1 Tax=Ferrimonas marina TaxID=299255 RepID=A0A1M5N1A2_9GAMM|nr:acetolactate synthase large subunit [Ferrimonas marina]SHG83182.1 acetolactate synthase-1/2/3 large subunit [Ferrimonas marina]
MVNPDPSNDRHPPQTNAAELMVQALQAEGVKQIFAVPGEENLDLLQALHDSDIELVLTRHEQGAAFMAATYGRLTGRAGVCMATLGPGATNFTTCAAYAQLGGFPLVMITGQKPIKTSKQGQFQVVDVVNLFKPITKLSHQIVHGDRIPSQVREAFRQAEEERPGAVLLELPEDIAREPVHAEVFQRSVRAYAEPSPEVIDQVADAIRQAKHPLLLLGAGANRQEIGDALCTLLSCVPLYFCSTQMGKGVVDEAHPRCLGTAALSAGDYLHCAIDRADLIINVGHDVVEKPPFFMEHGGKTVVHINYRSAQVDPVYFPQFELVGDVAATIEALSQRLDGLTIDNAYFGRIHDEIRAQLSEGSDDERFPVVPQRLLAEVRAAMGPEDVIALDNGIYKIWFARNYPAYRANTVLLDNALATMGAGLPSAMMAAMLYPQRRVMAICGDGGFMMNSQELETAVRLGLNLVVLILNDGAYGMIRWKQAQQGLSDWGLTFNNPDFLLYAQSYGAQGHRPNSAAQLRPVLERAFEQGGVHLVDVAVDYSENQRVLIDQLQQKVCLL